MALSAAQLARLQARLELYYAAEAAILRNQSYEMPDGRKLARANLKDVQAMIKSLEGQIDGGGDTPIARGRARRGVVR